MNLIGNAEPRILFVDLGGTETRIHGQEGDKKLQRVTFDTAKNYNKAITKLGGAASAIINGKAIDAIGFAVAGEVKAGRLVRAGALEEYGYVGEPMQDDIANELGIESDQVVLLNDCVSAAKSQQRHNQRIGSDRVGYVETISTGLGGAGFDGDLLIPDEPGHEYLRKGALCGCGTDGCVEAHISGGGIERNRKIRAENLPRDQWRGIVDDAVDAHVNMVRRFNENDFQPTSIYLFGSVALKSGVMLQGISEGLLRRANEMPYVPNIALATYGGDSGLEGARLEAYELATNI